ncbi:hypothetical protein Cgig2_012283 [Carnegiea gigantea]|uniref:Poly A polymerase head domain-containing protein n=1 Tax=Carnegiea gigantea TaxID=171969 RepID=A0A9Q1JRG1_9CARY|nr:hypothetical protein Cgig2_012283 [Carnegiea gigantea]
MRKATSYLFRICSRFYILKSMFWLQGRKIVDWLVLLLLSRTGHVDTCKWKRMDSRKLGISLSMIPEASRIFVKVLQNEGYDAYLVGGCVRDLLLSKTPKDFDVITTATLQEIKENFRRAFIVRGRFPICRVHVKGSTIEVSNFETAARDAEEKEDVQLSTLSERYDQQDIMRWRNSLQWDFTINSLFYDPFADTIYDYSSRMTDLTFLKLRTLIPANLSFKEDCGRWFALLLVILAEHSKDTEKEIRTLYASVATLKKAAYLASQSGARNPSMLMVFISKNAGRQVAHIFGVLMDDIESLEPERHYYSIDYKSLGKGDIVETRFVLGKVIMETMKDGVSHHQACLGEETIPST